MLVVFLVLLVLFVVLLVVVLLLFVLLGGTVGRVSVEWLYGGCTRECVSTFHSNLLLAL
jgi:hypothetical protein